MRFVLIFVLFLVFTPLRAEMESWYTYWSLGTASINYSQPVASYMNTLESQPQTFTRTQSAGDFFGFYWPLDNQTILGFVMSTANDTITRVDSKEPKNFSEMFLNFPYFSGISRYVSLQQTLLGASTMRFYGKEVGDGFYIRGDAGIARLEVKSETSVPVSNKQGFGLLAGIGYGFMVSEKSRLLLGLTYRYNKIGSYEYKSATFTIGGLW